MLLFRPLVGLKIALVLVTFACHKTTVEACVDQQNYCADFQYFCNSWAWMQDNCKKTCGFCSGASSSWTQCTKTCGSGTRYKETCNGAQCVRDYEACNTNDCAAASCSNYWEKRRYGIPHACCNIYVSPSDNSCGNPGENRRVVGGSSANFKSWPWTTALIWNEKRICGGVLISTRYVLTAAHCVSGYSASGWRAHFGLLRLSDRTSGSRITKIDVHHNYNFNTFANDIAIMELKSLQPITSVIKPICLPGGEVTPQDTTCFVTGWGVSDHSGWSTSTNHLQEGALQNLDPRICREKFSKIPSMQHVMPYLNSNTGYLCAGSLHKRIDTCPGDSGGPLACQRCASCSWYLGGIVSFGHPTCGTHGVPAVYTRVRDYENWIASITGTAKPSMSCSRSTGP